MELISLFCLRCSSPKEMIEIQHCKSESSLAIHTDTSYNPVTKDISGHAKGVKSVIVLEGSQKL